MTEEKIRAELEAVQHELQQLRVRTLRDATTSHDGDVAELLRAAILEAAEETGRINTRLHRLNLRIIQEGITDE